LNSLSCAWPQIFWVQFYVIVGVAALLVLQHITVILGSTQMAKITKQTSIAFAAAAATATAVSVAFAASGLPLVLLLSRLFMIPLAAVVTAGTIRTVFVVRSKRREAKGLVGLGRGPTDPVVFVYRKIGRNVNLLAGALGGGSFAFLGLNFAVLAQQPSVLSLATSSLIEYVILVVLGLGVKVALALTTSQRALGDDNSAGPQA
jgi:hypothetical protein